jgi:polyisoprenoid-binding protein YceI
MRLLRVLLFFLLPMLVSLSGIGQNWSFKGGVVTFRIKNAGLSVDGRLQGILAQVQFDPSKPESTRIEGSADVATLATGIAMRDRHLKKEDYFHQEKHPAIRMKLTSLEKRGTDYAGTFSLTLKGTTRTLANLPVRFQANGTGATLSTDFELNRLDYGVGESSWTLADMVRVRVVFELKKDPAP